MLNCNRAAVSAALFFLVAAAGLHAQQAEPEQNEFTDQVMNALDKANQPQVSKERDEGPSHRHTLDIGFESEVLATQGDAVVTKADMEVFLSRMKEEHRSSFLIDRNRVGRALSNLMLPRLLTQVAKEEGFLNNSDLQAKLFQSASVLIGQEYMNQYYRERELDDYSQPAREMYLADPKQFKSPTRYDFTHILVAVGRTRGELEAMGLVREIYERLEEGATVEELVPEYSDDPQVEDNEGTYEGVELDKLDEAVAQAVSRMEPGQISEPVRSVYGWHVIRLDDVEAGRQLEWEEARNQAMERARERHMTRARERLVQKLKESEVTIEAQNLREFLARYNVAWDRFQQQ